MTDIPLRFAASKIIEGDNLILDRLDLDGNEKEMIEHIVLQMEKERGLDHSAAIADMRFLLLKRFVNKPLLSLKKVKSVFEVKKLTAF